MLAISLGLVIYSITIIKGHYSWFTGCYSFTRIKEFDSFPWDLNIIPISFKIFVIISLYSFLHKSGEQISIFFVVSVKFIFQHRYLTTRQSKIILVEISALSSSIFKKSSQSREKQSGIKFFKQIWFSPFQKYQIYCLRCYQKYQKLL